MARAYGLAIKHKRESMTLRVDVYIYSSLSVRDPSFDKSLAF